MRATKAQQITSLQEQLTAANATIDDLRKGLIEAQERRDVYYREVFAQRADNALLQSQRDTLRTRLAQAGDAIEEVNKRLRTVTLCKCQVIEVTAGDWQVFRTVDCPVHPHNVEVAFPL